MTIPRMEKFRDSWYVEGIDTFFAYADHNPGRSQTWKKFCSCEKCKNNKMLDRAFVREHLVWCHFYKEYTLANPMERPTNSTKISSSLPAFPAMFQKNFISLSKFIMDSCPTFNSNLNMYSLSQPPSEKESQFIQQYRLYIFVYNKWIVNLLHLDIAQF